MHQKHAVADGQLRFFAGVDGEQRAPGLAAVAAHAPLGNLACGVLGALVASEGGVEAALVPGERHAVEPRVAVRARGMRLNNREPRVLDLRQGFRGGNRLFRSPKRERSRALCDCHGCEQQGNGNAQTSHGPESFFLRRSMSFPTGYALRRPARTFLRWRRAR